MAKGDPCANKACENVRPCPLHTNRGTKRRNKMAGLDNVTELFTDERRAEQNDMRPKGGKGSTQPEEQREADKRTQIFVKQRLGKRWSQIHSEVAEGMYSWEEFVEQLDAEELARGQLKAEDGTFRGRPPEFIPRTFYLACQREMVTRFNNKMQGNLEKATDELIKLATDPELMEAKDRAKWLQYIIERVMGKIPDRVEVKAADPWETIIGDILAEAPADMQVPQYMKSRQAGENDGST